MKLNNREATRFLSSPTPFRVVLFHGEDSGRIRERSQHLRQKLLGPGSDPFRALDLGPSAIKEDPSRLLDEAQSYSLAGQPMVIRVTGVTDSIQTAIKDLLEHDQVVGQVVLEAGQLTGKSKLRQLIEKSKEAVSIACYQDNQRDLDGLIDDVAGKHSLVVEPAAKAYLVSHLGADHMASRSELEKLCLFAHGRNSISLADAQSCVGDGAQHKIDDAIYAIASGDVAVLETVLGKLSQEGQSPIAVVRRALSYFQKLHIASGQLSSGRSADDIARSQRPPLYFKALDNFKRHVASWTQTDIETALDFLFQCEIDLKGSVVGPDLSASRTLLRLAMIARRRQRRR